MANLSYKNDEQEDERLNPASTARNLQAAEESSAYSSAGADQAEAFANDPANATKEQEESPNSINYTGSGSSQKQPFSFRGQLRKKGPIGAIIALLLGGGGGLFMLFSPGLAVVQIKELMTEDLNDQLGAMDIRTAHVFKAKLSDLEKNNVVCRSALVKCGFRGMSDRQIAKFKAAGIEVKPAGEKNNLTRKTPIKSLEITDGSGNKIKLDKPSDLNRLLADRAVRNSFRKAFNPKFAGFYDKASASVFAKYKTNKADKLSGKTREEFDKNINDSVDGKTGTLEARTIGATDEEKEQAKQEQEKVSAQEERIKASTGGVGGVFSSAGKGLSVLGVADTACTVKSTARAVSAGAKVLRAAQLAGFAMVFLNFADQVKAGTATAEQAEYVGDKLTAVDTDKKIVNENSPVEGDTPQEIDNPYYGSNAFDSAGYKVAAYNDAPTLSSRDLQFTIGGALSGSLASVLEKIGNIPGANSCSVVQNPIVRGLGLGGGLLLGFGSGGTSIALSVAGSVAVAAALPLLEAYLSDMLAGRTVSSKTKGVDAGDAIFSGTAALQGDTAASRGMKPLNKDEIKSYQAYSNDIKEQYIAMETEDAKKTPFDMYNQYSFLGSFARKLLPSVSSSSSNASGALSGVGSIVSTASTSLLPTAKAVGTFNSERFNKCEDEGYEKIGIDADVFCNVRFGMSAEELNMETDTAIDAMIGGGYIDTNGTPQGEYAEWLQECTRRTNGWGEGDEGTNKNNGAECMKTGDKYSYFRVYTMDNSINEAMEYEGPSSGGLAAMTFNILGTEQGDRNNNDGGIPWKKRADAAVSIIGQYQPAILGLQEVNDVQFDYIKPRLSGYDSVPVSSKGSGQPETIMWNTSVFTKVSGGTYAYPKGDSTSTAVWVKLQSGGGYVYVFNAHPTADRDDEHGAGFSARQRKEVTNIIIKEIKKVNTDNSPVVITGDFNATSYLRRGQDTRISTGDLPSSLLARAGYSDARDIATEKINEDYQSSHGDAGAPRERDTRADRANKIDHIYVSSGITVGKWENIIDENSRIASDHTPIIASLNIPGISSATQSITNAPSKDGWIWPIQKNLFPGPCYGGASVHAGMDINTSNLNNPLLAAHDGVVTGTPTGGAGGNQIRVKTDNGMYYWYQHMKQPTNKKVGDRVRAGEQVGVAGRTGNVQVRAGYAHFHFVVHRKNDYPSYGNLGSSINPLTVLPTPAPGGYKCT